MRDSTIHYSVELPASQTLNTDSIVIGQWCATRLNRVKPGRKHRFFTRQQKQNLWDSLAPGDRVCADCKKPLIFENADVDHVEPWTEGGETVEANGQLMHPACNRAKGARWDPVTDESVQQ